MMHPSHKEHIGRLNRVTGQVDAIKRMIDENRYCVDIMTQIRAARSALKSVEIAMLETHMKSCLEHACSTDSDSVDKKIDEIMTLLKKYK